MKDFKGILGCALISCGLIGMIVCAIAAGVFAWQNTDMTEMRRFIEYPWPTVWTIVDCVGIHVGCRLIEN